MKDKIETNNMSFSERAKAHLTSYKEAVLKIHESGYAENKVTGHRVEHGYILPKGQEHLNLLPSVSLPPELSKKGSDLNQFNAFLNSSQMVCVNFFQLMTTDDTCKKLLINRLENRIPRLAEINTKIGNTEIVKKQFEYIPLRAEFTHFDYYIELANGVRLFFEIKYTEKCFGAPTKLTAKPEAYDEKWNSFYAVPLKCWRYKYHANQQQLSETNMFEHYQFWRNVSFLESGKDFFICIYPQENASLKTEFETIYENCSTNPDTNKSQCSKFPLSRDNIKGLTWESFVLDCITACESPLTESLNMFYEKYFNLDKVYSQEFVHLHVHSAYSHGDGVSSIGTLVRCAKGLGMKALALTDHGSMFGAEEFINECKIFSIKPIIGEEFYVAQDNYTANEKTKYGTSFYHLILLCQNKTGYYNMQKLSHESYKNGYHFHRPAIDFELLKKYHEGLICLSACMLGELAQFALHDKIGEAEQCAEKYADLFGKNRYYIELQNHGMEEQKRIAERLIPIAQKLDLPMVITNDVHYAYKDDAPFQSSLRTSYYHIKKDDNFTVMGNGQPEWRLKSAEEMSMLFPDYPEMMTNTSKIADMCDMISLEEN